MYRLCLIIFLFVSISIMADGVAKPPKFYKQKKYKGSIEEKSQEAIIIFHGSEVAGKAREDLILKISVVGDVDHFSWIIPFPEKPEIAKEDPKLFSELFRYVEKRLLQRRRAKRRYDGAKSDAKAKNGSKGIDILSRQVVGSYETTVVKENKKGALNAWLDKEGYQSLENAEDVLSFYRDKGYVFACIKVSQAALKLNQSLDLHPLRFSFRTRGRDGIYFPMKLSGLQSQPFDVNLYVFYRVWINDQLSKFGYVHRGFELKYRDWDTPQCESDAGKAYSAMKTDPFLKRMAYDLPTIEKFFQKLHPGERYYLTNIQAKNLAPGDVRVWADDLWLFPYYTSSRMIPYDVRNNGPAAATWPNEKVEYSQDDENRDEFIWGIIIGVVIVIGLVVLVLVVKNRIYNKDQNNNSNTS